ESWEGPHTGRGPQGYQRSNERIKEEACEILTRHGHIDASGVTVEVNNGEVTLTGTVNSRREKRLAEEVLENLSGVKDVHNQLRVSGREGNGGGQGSQAGQTSGLQTGGTSSGMTGSARAGATSGGTTGSDTESETGGRGRRRS
ncbi:MAG TPA: BON domain-containing protein, partial [Thermoanaerobaculia bacterium]